MKKATQHGPKKHGESLMRLVWILPFLAAFMPIVLMTVHSLRLATDSVSQLVEAENLSATRNISHLLTREFTTGINLIRAMASVPGTVTATEEKDPFTLSTRLKAIVVSYPEIDRAFVTDRDGVL